jgi:hypothetical protein
MVNQSNPILFVRVGPLNPDFANPQIQISDKYLLQMVKTYSISRDKATERQTQIDTRGEESPNVLKHCYLNGP